MYLDYVTNTFGGSSEAEFAFCHREDQISNFCIWLCFQELAQREEIGPIKYICLKECRGFCAEHSFSTWSRDWLYCSEIRSTITPGQVRAVSNQRLYVICSIHCSVCQLMKARNIAFHWIFRNSSKLYQLSKISFFSHLRYLADSAYTASHSSPSRFTMLALAEEDFCGSTPSLFLQIYNKMAARRKAISPMRPRIAGTFIVFLCTLLRRRAISFFLPFNSFNLLWPRQS